MNGQEIETTQASVSPGSPLKIPVGAGKREPVPILEEEWDMLRRKNAELAAENARLVHERALVRENAALALENARLAQQNADLRSQSQPPYDASLAQRMPEYGWWGPLDPWTLAQMQHMQGSYTGEYIPQQSSHKSSKKRSGMFGFLKGGRKAGGTASASSSFQNPHSCGETSSSALSTFEPPIRSCFSAPSSFESPVLGGADESYGLDPITSIELEGPEPSSHHDEQPQTTVMMRNLPNNYTRDQLQTLIDDKGFAGSYDLIYLPMDFQREAGLGYAFINFIEPETVDCFRECFQGFKDWSIMSEKVCDVSWSDVLQGVASHVDRYRNSPMMHDSVPDHFKPALFQDGERASFPPPTKRLRPPRQWLRKQG